MPRPRETTTIRRDLQRALAIDGPTIHRDLEQAITTMLDTADPLTATTYDLNPVSSGGERPSSQTERNALRHHPHEDDQDHRDPTAPPTLPRGQVQTPARATQDHDTTHALARRITNDLHQLRKILNRYTRTCPDCGEPLTRYDTGTHCQPCTNYRNQHGRRASARTIANRQRMRDSRT